MSFNKKPSSIIGALLFFNIISWVGVYQLSSCRFLEVVFFDVGEGEAIFIQTPQRHQILIDGGASSTILEKLGKEMPFWDRSIDLIILTHPHHDHLAGLIEVLKRYKVENILWTGIVRENPEYQEWLRLIKKEKAKIIIAQAGERISWQNSLEKKGHFDILYPFKKLRGKRFKDINKTSIAGELVFGEVSFLFTGDAPKSVERKLIKKYPSLEVNILKVGHHGSKNSTDEEFIKEISPEMAVILVGKNNPYGHPHREVLQILKKYDIKILRTDYQGDIKIFSDGENFKIQTSKTHYERYSISSL